MFARTDNRTGDFRRRVRFEDVETEVPVPEVQAGRHRRTAGDRRGKRIQAEPLQHLTLVRESAGAEPVDGSLPQLLPDARNREKKRRTRRPEVGEEVCRRAAEVQGAATMDAAAEHEGALACMGQWQIGNVPVRLARSVGLRKVARRDRR
jgi:hypothetical protein